MPYWHLRPLMGFNMKRGEKWRETRRTHFEVLPKGIKLVQKRKNLIRNQTWRTTNFVKRPNIGLILTACVGFTRGSEIRGEGRKKS